MRNKLFYAADALLDAEHEAQAKRRKRDDLIIEERARGVTLRDIGSMVGLSHQAVALIVKSGAPRVTTTETQAARQNES